VLQANSWHNIPAYLGAPFPGYGDVIHWLSVSSIHYALFENPKIFIHHIEQFWRTATFVKKECALKATVDGRTVLISEEVVRKALKFGNSVNDPKGTPGDDIKTFYTNIRAMSEVKSSRPNCQKNGDSLHMFLSILYLIDLEVSMVYLSTGPEI
jgi:hypothetical protein